MFLGAEPLIEYFVPRSVSEFDLSMTGVGGGGVGGANDVIPNILPLTARLTRKLPQKTREKMVTFEDELAAAAAAAAAAASVTTKTKGPDLQDVFM